MRYLHTQLRVELSMPRSSLFVLIACFYVVLASNAQGQLLQDTRDELVGVSLRGLWSATDHTPSFSALPGTVDCGTYTTGSGSALGAALTLEYPLPERFHIGLGATFISRGGRLRTPNDREPAFDSTTGQVVDVVTENALDVRLDYIELAPTLWWTPLTLGRSTIRLNAGVRFGIPLRAEMQQTRHIVSPDNAVFTSNQQRTINWTGGFQPMSQLRRPTVGAHIGIEHLLPIGSRLHFVQQLAYDYVFTSPVADVRWTMQGIRLELGVRMSLERSAEQIEAPAPPPPPPPGVRDTPHVVIAIPPLEVPRLHLAIESFDGYIEEGTELVATPPLVNAVFFDAGSAVIPRRYVLRSADSIATDDPVVAHRNILLVIADILRRNPNARVICEGATAGEYEQGDTALARRRAEAVARVLESLGIERSRIGLRASLLPSVASNMDYPEGRTENQRVDIVLINAPLVEYVSKQTFAELVGTLAVHLTGSALSGDSILLEATGAEPKLRGDTGTARVPIRLRLAPAAEHVVLSAHGAIPQTGIQASDSVTVVLSTLSRRRVELSTARFEAVLRFDYNSSQLSAENRELLRQLIERIPDGATIEIGGSADVLGDIARNRRLAEERARATESYLRTLAASKRILIVARGIERRFSDTLPEGRFLNRSIRVTLP